MVLGMIMSSSLNRSISRRGFLATAAAAPLALASPAGKQIPIGLEMYSVRGEMAKDVIATVRMVGKMGYQVVEFFGPYFQWTPEFAKDVRKALDDTGLKCNSTHNNGASFTGDGIAKAIELNKILGSKFIVMASAGRPAGVDGWKKVAETLTSGSEKFRAAGLRGGYHNHAAEFATVENTRPMDVIAANTPKDFMLQFDVGTCVEMKQDPVAWINANPGRINSLHLKDWGAPQGDSKDRGYRVLFGEGDCPWMKIFDAAEKTGGAEYYLIEQEGSRFPEFETAEKCLATYKKMRA
jgi:sugar phosphate isomerase/epimerase